MRAIRVTEHGGPEVLTVADVPEPTISPAQVLVRTDAIGVNFIDTYFRTGAYPRDVPYIPGSEGSGVVIAVGDEVTGFATGDRVAWFVADAGYAEQVAVDAERAVPVPDGIEPDVAASALLQGVTAHYLLHSVYDAQPGDTVLVHAGAGGVGLMVTQLAAANGVRVITTVSTDEKEALSREAGAAEVLRYDENIAERVRELTDGEGVAAVYDGVGKDTFEASLASLRVRGMLALFGAASGKVPPFDLQRLNPAGSLFVTRPTIAHYTRTDAELRERTGDIFAAITDAVLKVRVSARYPLADAAQAHRDLEGRKTTGSIVLLPR